MTRGRFHAFAIALAAAFAGAGCLVTIHDSGFATFEHQTEREETHALDLAAGRTLTLEGSSGDIRVSAATDGPSELRARLRAWGRTREEAEEVLARYHVEVSSDASGVRARLVGDPLERKDGSTKLVISADVDFVASVPAGVRLIAETAAGDVEARGPLAECRLSAQYGSIEVEDVRGTLDARTSTGAVHARRVEGDAVTLESEYGDVRLENAAAKRIACESVSGDVDIEEVRAPAVELSTSYGSVSVRNLDGDLRARSESGDVRATGVTGAVDAASGYGSVELEGVLAALRAETSSGNVRVRALPGSRVDPSWSLVSSYGSVSLWVPADFACELDARTEYGAVESDFPLFTETSERQEASSLEGRIGAGGATVKLRTSSGQVALKKL